ncbi:hypothetical protein ACFPM3_33380 [Streptomyces coeruleoprunus]|uniref:Uncharacterized protein n=1 Tax=Streptomyces coeruleoprunus TaxID=285563 RepID=A0ABV9XPH8_9ACTN
MRSGLLALRGGAAAALVLASTGLCTGGAHAAGDARVRATVTPSTAAPGADVDVRVEGCDGRGGTVGSPAFVADVELAGREGEGAPLYGDTTVRSATGPGAYPLTVVCDGREHPGAGRLHVARASAPGRTPAPDTAARPGRAAGPPGAAPPLGPSHTPPPSPQAPARAGGGGTAAFVADAVSVADQGPGTRHTVIGLVLAAVAAVAVALRSTRRRGGRPGAD